VPPRPARLRPIRRKRCAGAGRAGTVCAAPARHAGCV